MDLKTILFILASVLVFSFFLIPEHQSQVVLETYLNNMTTETSEYIFIFSTNKQGELTEEYIYSYFDTNYPELIVIKVELSIQIRINGVIYKAIVIARDKS